jgi:hypothetical protein
MPESELRKKIRGLTLGLNTRRVARVTFDRTVDGRTEAVTVEVREPTIEDQIAIWAAGGIDFAKASETSMATVSTPFAMFVETALRCTYIPLTGERAFDEIDRADLMSRPSSDAGGEGWIMKIGKAAMALLGEDAAKKNSATIQTSSSSTPSLSSADAPTSTPSETASPSAN